MNWKALVIGIVFFAALALNARSTFACSCGPRPNVLDVYERADLVLIARVVSVQPADKQDYYVNGMRSATGVVEKIYKGTMRVRDELVFAQGSGSDCIFTFSGQDIGERILFYLNWDRRQSNLWYATFCNRSRGVDGAKEDLLYLDNIEKLRGKTRVSGELGRWNDANFPVSHKKIRIRGEKKTYETTTDENGFYEIYNLPPGRYSLEPEMPKGWQIARSWLRYVGDADEEQNSKKSVGFTLQPKRHASIDVSFEPDNAVEGSIVDSAGNPMEGVCAYLWTPERTEGFGPSDCTDKEGKFRIDSVPAGTYVLVVNPYGADSKHNFPRMFYPSVTQRDKAALITISTAEVLKGINLVIPNVLETVTVSGVVKYSDDRPAGKAPVEFEAVQSEGIDGDERTDANSLGQFTFKLIKGLKGEVSAKFYASIGEYQDCPQLDALIQATGQRFAIIKTPPLKIEAAQDLDNLVLRFPFPRCKRKEREPR